MLRTILACLAITLFSTAANPIAQAEERRDPLAEATARAADVVAAIAAQDTARTVDEKLAAIQAEAEARDALAHSLERAAMDLAAAAGEPVARGHFSCADDDGDGDTLCVCEGFWRCLATNVLCTVGGHKYQGGPEVGACEF